MRDSKLRKDTRHRSTVNHAQEPEVLTTPRKNIIPRKEKAQPSATRLIRTFPTAEKEDATKSTQDQTMHLVPKQAPCLIQLFGLSIAVASHEDARPLSKGSPTSGLMLQDGIPQSETKPDANQGLG